MKFTFVITLICGIIIGRVIYDEIKRTIQRKKNIEMVNDIRTNIENATLEQIGENTFAIGNVKIKITKGNLNNVD